MITTDTLLTIWSSILGIASSIAFVIGTLSLSSKGIEQMAGTYWGYNKYVAESLVKQKTQYTIGALFLAFSFILTGVKSIYSIETLNKPVNGIENEGYLAVMLIVLLSLIYLLLYYVMKNYVLNKVKKNLEANNT